MPELFQPITLDDPSQKPHELTTCINDLFALMNALPYLELRYTLEELRAGHQKMKEDIDGVRIYEQLTAIRRFVKSIKESGAIKIRKDAQARLNIGEKIGEHASLREYVEQALDLKIEKDSALDQHITKCEKYRLLIHWRANEIAKLVLLIEQAIGLIGQHINSVPSKSESDKLKAKKEELEQFKKVQLKAAIKRIRFIDSYGSQHCYIGAGAGALEISIVKLTQSEARGVLLTDSAAPGFTALAPKPDDTDLLKDFFKGVKELGCANLQADCLMRLGDNTLYRKPTKTGMDGLLPNLTQFYYFSWFDYARSKAFETPMTTDMVFDNFLQSSVKPSLVYGLEITKNLFSWIQSRMPELSTTLVTVSRKTVRPVDSRERKMVSEHVSNLVAASRPATIAVNNYGLLARMWVMGAAAVQLAFPRGSYGPNIAGVRPGEVQRRIADVPSVDNDYNDNNNDNAVDVGSKTQVRFQSKYYQKYTRGFFKGISSHIERMNAHIVLLESRLPSADVNSNQGCCMPRSLFFTTRMLKKKTVLKDLVDKLNDDTLDEKEILSYITKLTAKVFAGIFSGGLGRSTTSRLIVDLEEDLNYIVAKQQQAPNPGY